MIDEMRFKYRLEIKQSESRIFAATWPLTTCQRCGCAVQQNYIWTGVSLSLRTHTHNRISVNTALLPFVGSDAADERLRCR